MHIRGIFVNDGKSRGNSSIYQHILLLILKMYLVQYNVPLEFRGKSGRFASVILFITSLQSFYTYSTKTNKRILNC